MKKTNNFKKPTQNKYNNRKNNQSIKKEKPHKGMIKLYTDYKTLSTGLLALFEADKDISKFLPEIDNSVRTDNPSDIAIFHQIAIELGYLLQELLIHNEFSSLWDMHISENKLYVRTNKYNSFGWNKHIEKDKTGKEIVTYRMFLTLYGYKAEDTFRNNITNKEIWKVLEEK